MEIITKKVRDLKPYKNNPRNNKEAIDYVARSIEEFGFKVPIVIDKDNVVICGHTRLLASKRLKLKEVPCIIADDLSEEQIKAYRLADNKVSEKSEWDLELLEDELSDIFDIDMESFGFDFNFGDAEEDSYTEEIVEEQNENVRSVYMYNIDFYDESRTVGKWGMPQVDATDYIPNDLIGFNYALSYKDKNIGIHCYVDDYQIERLWNSPLRYIDILRQYDCVLMPDFSMTIDMPVALKLWNCFRAKLIAQFWQDQGLTVIPTIRFSSRETWDWCFDGMPKHSVVALSVQSVSKKEDFKWWQEAVYKFIDEYEPTTILLYGNEIDMDFKGVPTKYYKNKVTDKFRGVENG